MISEPNIDVPFTEFRSIVKHLHLQQCNVIAVFDSTFSGSFFSCSGDCGRPLATGTCSGELSVSINKLEADPEASSDFCFFLDF
jgi:hypothetical protein